MLRLLVTISFVFSLSTVSAQNDTLQCEEFSQVRALKDIQQHQAQLIIRGGFVPVRMTAKDTTFIKRYKVSFYDSGCVLPDSEECVIAYNKTVFQHLDKRYGKKWRRQVRKDVMGL